MKLITLEHILQLHVMTIEMSGGSSGIRDLGRIESALATQTQQVFGDYVYPTVFEKAAAITRGIIADHPFVDGNKRTGMLGGLTLLEINGVQTVIPQGNLEDFAVRIAVESLDINQIAKWFKENSKKLAAGKK